MLEGDISSFADAEHEISTVDGGKDVEGMG